MTYPNHYHTLTTQPTISSILTALKSLKLPLTTETKVRRQVFDLAVGNIKEIPFTYKNRNFQIIISKGNFQLRIQKKGR